MPGQEVFKDMIGEVNTPLSIVVLFIILGIFAPVLEEFLFRYWIKSRKRAVSTALYAAMGCYVALSTFWWLGSGGFLLCVLLDLLLGDKANIRMLTLMLATSLIFALAHITGFSAFNIDSVTAITELFGLGLVACWLVYNIGFWYACLLHALKNIVALLIVLLSPASSMYTPAEVNFDTPLYSATLKPSSEEGISLREINDSTVVAKGKLPVIANLLVEYFDPAIIERTYSAAAFFKIDLSFRNEPCWDYTLTFHDTIPYGNAPQLVTELAKQSLLQIDTTYEEVYVIGIEDTLKLEQSTGEWSGTLASLAEDIRIIYDCPVVLEDGINVFRPVEYGKDLMQYPYDISKLPSILADKLGLSIHKSEGRKIPVICFSSNPR